MPSSSQVLEREKLLPALAPARQALHSATHELPSSGPGLLPTAGLSPLSVLPPHFPPAPLPNSVRRAGCHTPAPADRTTAPALLRTSALRPPRPGAGNTRYAPVGLPPSPGFRQAPLVHIHGSSRASAGAARPAQGCPDQPGVTSACPAGRTPHPAPVRSHLQVHHASPPSLPGCHPPRRWSTGGRAAVLLLRAGRSSTRWCRAVCAGALAHPVAHRSRRPADAPTVPAVPGGAAA